MIGPITVGVDIGTHSIKCAVLNKLGKEYHIRLKKTYPIPQGDEDFIFITWLKSTLQDFVKENKIAMASFCFSLSYGMPKMGVRIFDMPKLSRKVLEQSMSFELEEKFSVQEADKYSFKWDVLKIKEEDYSVLLSILEKDIVKSFKAMSGFKLKTKIIEPQIVSYGRLMEGDCVVVDFGHSATRILAYRNGVPFSFQSSNIGGRIITEKIAEDYPEISDLNHCDRLVEAERIKHEKGAVLLGHEEIETDDEVIKVAGIIANPVKEILQGIKHALEHLKEFEGFVPEKIHYTGNAAMLKYLPNYISRELALDLVPLGFTSAYSVEDGDVSSEDNYIYMAAGGAWLTSDYSYLKNLNFTTTKFSIKKINPLNIFILLLGFSLVLQVGAYDLNRRADKFLSGIDSKIQQQQSNIKSSQSVTTKYNDIVTLLSNIQGQKKWLSDILYELPKKTPAGLAIKEIVIKDNTIVLRGISRNYSDIGFFAISLEELGKVDINTIENSDDTGSYIQNETDKCYKYQITLIANKTVLHEGKN